MLTLLLHLQLVLFASSALVVAPAPRDADPDALAAVVERTAEIERLIDGARRAEALDALRALVADLPATPPDPAWDEPLGVLSLRARELGAVRARLLVLDARLELLRAHRHEDEGLLASVRLEQVQALAQAGRDAEGMRVAEDVVRTLSVTRPPEDELLLNAKLHLGIARRAVGDLRGAARVQEEILAAYERTRPEDDLQLNLCRINLSGTHFELGDYERSLSLAETALLAVERALGPEHLYVQKARACLASSRWARGDQASARVLFERALAGLQELLPESHPDVLAARLNLAVVMDEAGDFEGARQLNMRTLEILEDVLPPDHPEILRARNNLAAALKNLARHEAAEELLVEQLAALRRTLPPTHPDLSYAKLNLAAVFKDRADVPGRIEDAFELECEALAALEEQLDDLHPRLLHARHNHALTLELLGRTEDALALQLEVTDVYRELLPAGTPRRMRAEGDVVMTLVALGRYDEARSRFPGFLESVLARLEEAQLRAPRQAREIAGSLGVPVQQALLQQAAGRVMGQRELTEIFCLLETRRHVAVPGLEGIGTARVPALADLRRAAARHRDALNDRAVAGPSPGESLETWKDGLFALARERDEALAELRRVLDESGARLGRICPRALSARLAPGAAAVGYHRVMRLGHDTERAAVRRLEPTLLVTLLHPGGRVELIDLGRFEPIEDLVRSWRAALASGRERGLPVNRGEREEARGRALRRAILDPVLERLPDAPPEGALLHVCLDDLLHLVPLDALPLGEEGGGGRVGDRYRVHHEVSFARLLTDLPEPAGRGLLVLGDADFGRPPRGACRSGEPAWRRLTGTIGEVRAVATYFQERFAEEPLVLTRDAATKAALRAGVAGRRYVHLATHGWLRDTHGEGGAVHGLAPLTLCGLCLAGANRGPDALGRRAGLLTAEELAGFDLSGCELAVLSACETSLGVRRAGLGVLSLQAGLHAAGARTTVTSLWSVDDDLTQELMKVFYENLWARGMTKADALWNAKRALRAEGLPVSAWAGWVLTGE